MQGSLADTNVPDLVVQVYSSRKNGILRLVHGEIKKSLYFKEGSIVFAHSNLKQERLGEVLLRLGKITEQEFRSVSGKLGEGMRLGQALYEGGFLSPAEINSGVSYQIQQIVYSVFNWDQGEFEFVQRERPVYEDIMVDTSTPQMIVDGIRNISNPAVLERVVQKLEDRVVALNPGSRRLFRTNLDFSEETLLACIDGKSTSAQLRAMSRLSSSEFGRALYCLSVSGMILFDGSDRSPAAEPARRPPVAPAGPLNTQPMPPVDPGTEPSPKMKTFTELELRRLIAETDRKFEEATDEEVLNVFPDALPEEIESAYERYTSIFLPPYYAAERYMDLKDPLKRIVDRLSEAQQKLLEKNRMQRPFLDEGLSMPVAVTPQEVDGVNQLPESVNEFPETPEAAAKPRSLSELQAEAQLNPGNTALLREVGLKLQQAGKAREGEKLLLAALENEPRSIENHFALANFYQLQGLKFKAFKHLNVILQIDPENQKALELLGIKKRKGGLFEITS